MKYHKVIFYIILSFIISVRLFGNERPLRNIDYSRFTSAFGPRNLSSTHEFPDTYYDYDFHAGMDIKPFSTNLNPDNYDVYCYTDGQIDAQYKSTGNKYQWIRVKHGSGENAFYTKYTHIIPEKFNIGDPIDEGDLLGKLIDFGGSGYVGDHLDFRYYRNTEAITNYNRDNGAHNPRVILDFDNRSYDPPKIYYKNINGNPVEIPRPDESNEYPEDAYLSIEWQTTNHSDFEDKVGKFYFEFGIEVDDLP